MERRTFLGVVAGGLLAAPRIPIVRRPLPRRGGQAILYRCPGCSEPRRYLYLRSLVIGRLVDYQGPLCEACAGLRWASQGRYTGVLHRAFPAGVGLQASNRFPFPRHPQDPRAVSDPRLILDEFPDLVGDRQIGRDKGAFPVGADCWRRLPAEVKAAPRDGGSSPRWRPPGAKVLVWSSPMANKYEHSSRVQAGRLPVFCRQNQAYGFWDWSLSSDRLAA
jgi:hypothetical protein